MKIYLFAVFSTLLCCFAQNNLCAQSLNNSLSGFRVKKVDVQNANQPFTIHDAVKLVRFFMAQEGIERCETDLTTRKFKLIGRTGTDIQQLLRNPALIGKLTELGYALVPTGEIASVPTPALTGSTATTKNMPSKTSSKLPNLPPKTTVKPDCADCGEQQISEDLKKNVLSNAKYGSEILIDMSSGESEFSPATSAQLDSLRKAILNKKPK